MLPLLLITMMGGIYLGGRAAAGQLKAGAGKRRCLCTS
jgi:hypothetical protein